MRSPLLVVAFLLACRHPVAVGPTKTPSPGATPPAAPAPAPSPDPCAPVEGPATPALRAFRAELLASAAADPKAFQASLPDRVKGFRARHGTLLSAHAAWAFHRLPELALPDLESMADDPRVTPEVVAGMKQVLGEDSDGGNAFRSILGLLSADPAHAFAGIRGIVLSAVGAPGDPRRLRENILEGLAPAPLVRLNEDPEHPVLAMPKRADIFVVWFDHDLANGLFVPKRIRWVRRDPPLEPSNAIQTAGQAFQSFSAALEMKPGQPDDSAANLSTRLLTQAGEEAKAWLDPHASLLRAHAICLCKQLPLAVMPDLASWREEEGVWNLGLMTSTFPRLRWDARQAFLFLRTSVDSRTMKVGDYSGLALVDSLVPPTIYRASGDCKEPTLFLLEGDRALLVPFSSSPERGYFPTQVRSLRRP